MKVKNIIELIIFLLFTPFLTVAVLMDMGYNVFEDIKDYINDKKRKRK